MIQKVFGVNINFSSYDDLTKLFFGSDKRLFASCNQDFLNTAFEDLSFRDDLNKFDIIHPDGIGVLLAFFIQKKFRVFPQRINCPDLLNIILTKSEKINKSIYFIGGTESLVNTLPIKLEETYPKLKLLGYSHGYFQINDIEIIKEINELNPDILLVGMGKVKQEKWILRWKDKLKANKIYAIGGAMRIITEDRPRGCKIIQWFGLEWLVRLLYEPNYLWKRYIIGIPLFIIRIIKKKNYNT